MIKNINEIKRDFIRLRSNEKGLYLEVCQIRWPSPHKPASDWVCVKQFGETQKQNDTFDIHLSTLLPNGLYETDDGSGKVTSWAEIEKAINKLLNNRRYFRVCGRCRTLNPVGWMYDEFACSGCAEKHLGVVH
ncbi:MAG: hypothetical protein ACRC6D_13100 [Aeromonas sp.]